jgi:tetratricopeptide (TPR) repeat protein
MTLRLGAAVAFLLVALAATGAAADETADAKRFYVSGSRHYDLGEYEAALRDFKEAYRIHPDPVFLYNIAQCHRILKHYEEALSFYRSFLRRDPESPYRPDIERKIAALTDAIAKQQKEAASAPPKSAEPPPREPVKVPIEPVAPPPAAATPAVAVTPPRPQPVPVYKKWWLWTAVSAAVVVGVGVGVGVGLSRSNGAPPGSDFPGVSF